MKASSTLRKVSCGGVLTIFLFTLRMLLDSQMLAEANCGRGTGHTYF